MENRKHSYATIITTIALALFALFWTMIDGRLRMLEVQVRSIDRQVTAISTRLGIEQPGLTRSEQGRSGAAVASPLEDRP